MSFFGIKKKLEWTLQFVLFLFFFLDLKIILWEKLCSLHQCKESFNMQCVSVKQEGFFIL